jgi:hypothetical protein
MTLLNRLASVVNRLLHRAKDEQDLQDDLQGFVDLAAAQKVRDGVSPTEARRLAMLELGLPVRNPQELVQVTLETPGARNSGESFSYPIVRALALRHEILAAVAGFSGFSFNVGSPDPS